MNRLLRCCLPVLCAGLVLPISALAQTAPATAPAGAPPPGVRAPQKPKNLQILPENTDLRKVMHEYEGALGVECEFCHTAPDPVTHRGDRASDANPMKDNARAMIKMTQDLNAKYLTLLANRKDSDTISCGTCHRGEKHPSAFIAPPRPEGNRPPGASPAAMAPAATPPAK
jgi:Photosynthetic reaction centre cytochrome C subunit